MKKFNLILAVALLSVLPACNNDLWDSIHGIENQITTLDARVTRLEELCKEMNTNITALQTIVNVLQTNDYITSVTEVKKGGEVIGYTITFGKHNPITIYHGENGTDGKDGKDGIDGTNGQDGHTPVIGVAQDTDGIYYWTLDGEWLLDDNGNKLRVTGENGADGTNGTNGTNGTDGITPQLKIENDYWFISYDNGATWTQLGKAKGDKGDKGTDGTNGTNGKDGKDGDSMFQSITQDEDNVYFTLENGTLITVSKTPAIPEGGVQIVNGAIMAPFSVSATKKVYFSRGNLQYQASTNTWRFAEHQYDLIGSGNSNISASYSGWIDLFGWGTGNNPTYANTDGNYSTFIDWGTNAITNGGNEIIQWHTLTALEWRHLIGYGSSGRANHATLFALGRVNGVNGLILLPDDWIAPSGITFTASTTQGFNGSSGWFKDEYSGHFTDNSYSYEQWLLMESAGAVFLPAAGWRQGTDVSDVGPKGYYWTCTEDGTARATVLYFNYNMLNHATQAQGRGFGLSVRLVKDVE